jgi:acetate kinase
MKSLILTGMFRMGLTPLAGLPGATRSGSIDPSLVFHYTNEAGNLSPASTKEMHISKVGYSISQLSQTNLMLIAT